MWMLFVLCVYVARCLCVLYYYVCVVFVGLVILWMLGKSFILSLPLTSNKKQVEWTTIQTVAQNNGFLTTFIKWLNQQIQHKHNNEEHINNEQHTHTIRTTLTYYSPLVRKITNLFKCTNIEIAFKTTNTIQHITRPTTHQNTTVQEKSGIYKLTWNTCRLSHIGQTSRSLQQRHKEHIRYLSRTTHNHLTHCTHSTTDTNTARLQTPWPS